MTKPATGVILLNMGGPDCQEDVRPFLYNLFSDREIIPLGPPFMQKILAWLIARKRAPKSMLTYQKIGGGSPLKRITGQQALALQDKLQQHGHYIVAPGMRYWPPYSENVLQDLIEQGATRIIALTLYPHYSKATTGSSLERLKKSIRKNNLEIPLLEIISWPKQKQYVRAVADNIVNGLSEFDTNDTEVVYSAHSLPVSFIEAGDPYVEHTKQTIAEVEKLTGKRGHLCYQSRSGPVEWLEPSTPDMLKELAEKGTKNILMVPISFVSDHVETLYEIDMLYKEQAAELGMNLHSSKSLNCQDLFIDGLKELVLEKEREFLS